MVKAINKAGQTPKKDVSKTPLGKKLENQSPAKANKNGQTPLKDESKTPLGKKMNKQTPAKFDKPGQMPKRDNWKMQNKFQGQTPAKTPSKPGQTPQKPQGRQQQQTKPSLKGKQAQPEDDDDDDDDDDEDEDDDDEFETDSEDDEDEEDEDESESGSENEEAEANRAPLNKKQVISDKAPPKKNESKTPLEKKKLESQTQAKTKLGQTPQKPQGQQQQQAKPALKGKQAHPEFEEDDDDEFESGSEDDEDDDDDDDEEDEDEDEDEESEDDDEDDEEMDQTPAKLGKNQQPTNKSDAKRKGEVPDFPAKKAKSNEGAVLPKGPSLPTKLDKKLLEDEEERKRDRDRRSLFIKNVPKGTADEEIKALSSDILDIRRRNKDGRYCYINFASEQICQKNYEKLKNAKLGSHAIFVDYCGSKSQTKPTVTHVDEIRVDALKLYVGNLPRDTSEDELKKYFPSAIGIFRNKNKSFAFAQFDSPEKARQAFEKTKDLVISGLKVVVAFARLQGDGMKKPGPIQKFANKQASGKIQVKG